MALYFSEDGLPFCAPPYSDEENREFEERLRRGGDITIVRQKKPRIESAVPNVSDPAPMAKSRRLKIVMQKQVRAWHSLRLLWRQR